MNIPVDKDSIIRDSIMTLEMISYQIADLEKVKLELEARLAALFEHSDNGAKTYAFGKWKVTCKTGYILSLDKEEYEVLGRRLPAQFDPVKKSISYSVDAKQYNEALKYAGKEDLAILEKLIKPKPRKLHVSIRAGV